MSELTMLLQAANEIEKDSKLLKYLAVCETKV